MAQKRSLWNHPDGKIHDNRFPTASKSTGEELFITIMTLLIPQGAFSLMLPVHFIIVLSQIWHSNLRLVARPLQSERPLPQTTEEEHAKRCCAGQGSEMEDAGSVWDEQEPLTQRSPLRTESGRSPGSKSAPEAQSPHLPALRRVEYS